MQYRCIACRQINVMPIDVFPIDAGVAIINKKQQASCPRGSFG